MILKVMQINLKVLFILLLAVILGIALYSEHLKHLYRNAIKTIAFDLDPEKANNEFNTLLKKDVFHAYNNDKKIYDSVSYDGVSDFVVAYSGDKCGIVDRNGKTVTGLDNLNCKVYNDTYLVNEKENSWLIGRS